MLFIFGAEYMSTLLSPKLNHLLAALPTSDYKVLLPHLKLVFLPLNTLLCKSSHQMNYAYFPITTVVSLISDMSDGTSVEFALVGKEGMVNTSLYMGNELSSSCRSIVLCEGQAYRLERQIIYREFNRSKSLQHTLLNYSQTLLSHIAQTAVCNRLHSLKKQFCSFLLLLSDRLPSNDIKLTHELIAKTLGVRREGITEIAGNLQRSGLIRYRRGLIRILDCSGLEEQACECYHSLKRKSDYLSDPAINTTSDVFLVRQ